MKDGFHLAFPIFYEHDINQEFLIKPNFICIPYSEDELFLCVELVCLTAFLDFLQDTLGVSIEFFRFCAAQKIVELFGGWVEHVAV